MLYALCYHRFLIACNEYLLILDMYGDKKMILLLVAAGPLPAMSRIRVLWSNPDLEFE